MGGGRARRVGVRGNKVHGTGSEQAGRCQRQQEARWQVLWSEERASELGLW